MSRLYGLAACAEGMETTILNALPNVSYKNGSDGKGRRLEYTKDAEVIKILILPISTGVNLGTDSQATSNNWDVWMLVADSHDTPDGHWKWLSRAWRYLRKRGAANPGYLFGPYSVKECLERWPNKTKALLKRPVLDEEGNPTGEYTDDWAFPSLMGDDLSTVAEIDYRPVQQEIDDDSDPDPAILFPVGELP